MMSEIERRGVDLSQQGCRVVFQCHPWQEELPRWLKNTEILARNNLYSIYQVSRHDRTSPGELDPCA